MAEIGSHTASTEDGTIHDAASAWFVLLRDEAASDADRAAFDEWLHADPAHEVAYQKLELVWSGLEQVQRPPPRAINPGRLEVSRVAWRRRPAKRRPLLKGLAAVGISASVLWATLLAVPQGLFADFKTAAGEQRTVTMADGSTVDLNTQTAISVEYSNNRREITLHSGEAYFQVTTNPDNPFVVVTDIGTVRVLGTAFSVRKDETAATVIVTENRVEVSDRVGGNAVLKIGDKVSLTETGIGSIERANLQRALSWKRGRLVFEEQRLETVLDELGRYMSGYIVTADDGIADLPVSGVFNITDIGSTLQTIDQTLPVKVTRLSDWVVIVGRE